MAGDRRVPFYEVYKEADLALFTSIHEGFGNQLLEIVAAGLIPVVFEYESFRTDIKQNIPNFISFGGTYYEPAANKRKFLPQRIYFHAAEEIVAMWAKPDETKGKVAENLESARVHYDSKVVAKQFLASLK